MFWIRTWMLGIKSILLHPMRSALTVLGIFIGVASVIWLVAIGEGISQEAQRQIEGLGAENIIVRTIKPPSESSGGFRGAIPYGLTREDYDILVNTIPNLDKALPIREIRRQIHAPDSDPIDGRLVGCTPDYQEVNRLFVARGRFLTAADLHERHNYCVLAAELAQKLFPIEDPLHQRVYLPEHQDYYRVIGIMKPRNATAAIGGSLAGQDFSSDMYVPISTVRQLIGDFIVQRGSSTFAVEKVELNQITLQVNSVKNVHRTAALVRDAMGVPQVGAPVRGQAKVTKLRNDVSVVVPEELLEQARFTQMIFMILMGAIAAISLLVGGIGIMNIMLATVTERTREIGIRRALGATRFHIVAQFLVETITLSFAGGLVGIMGGFACLELGNGARDFVRETSPHLLEQLPASVATIEPTVVPITIPVSFFISVTVGVIFGLYPAIRAAQLNPIEALRHE